MAFYTSTIDKSPRYATRATHVPTVPHFAVLLEDGFRYDDGYGDSRSGPSYSQHEELQYLVFTSHDALSAWVLANLVKKDKFKIISSTPVDFEIKTEFLLK